MFYHKHEFYASFVNRQITILSKSVQDYYNNTLTDPSAMLQKQFWNLLS